MIIFINLDAIRQTIILASKYQYIEYHRIPESLSKQISILVEVCNLVRYKSDVYDHIKLQLTHYVQNNIKL